jgi:hypothetical protein
MPREPCAALFSGKCYNLVSCVGAGVYATGNRVLGSGVSLGTCSGGYSGIVRQTRSRTPALGQKRLMGAGAFQLSPIYHPVRAPNESKRMLIFLSNFRPVTLKVAG